MSTTIVPISDSKCMIRVGHYGAIVCNPCDLKTIRKTESQVSIVFEFSSGWSQIYVPKESIDNTMRDLLDTFVQFYVPEHKSTKDPSKLDIERAFVIRGGDQKEREHFINTVLRSSMKNWTVYRHCHLDDQNQSLYVEHNQDFDFGNKYCENDIEQLAGKSAILLNADLELYKYGIIDLDGPTKEKIPRAFLIRDKEKEERENYIKKVLVPQVDPENKYFHIHLNEEESIFVEHIPEYVVIPSISSLRKFIGTDHVPQAMSLGDWRDGTRKEYRYGIVRLL